MKNSSKANVIHKSWPIFVEGKWGFPTRCGAYSKVGYKNHKTQWKFVTCEKCLATRRSK